jgi:hypothetical protein
MLFNLVFYNQTDTIKDPPYHVVSRLAAQTDAELGGARYPHTVVI